MPRLFPLSLLAATALAGGCASTPFSQLDGSRYHRTTIDTYPVAIVKIDGASNLRSNPVYVEPGRRQVTVQGPPGGAHSIGDQETLALDIQPCTRYWLVAVKESPLAQRYTVKVDHQEAIGSCRPPA